MIFVLMASVWFAYSDGITDKHSLSVVWCVSSDIEDNAAKRLALSGLYGL